ncbi:MAG: hypothetical protein JO237_10705 [Pseudolabrys sp.]|nr:hypothetical protein [Pseudolabrys sp.]
MKSFYALPVAAALALGAASYAFATEPAVQGTPDNITKDGKATPAPAATTGSGVSAPSSQVPMGQSTPNTTKLPSTEKMKNEEGGK